MRTRFLRITVCIVAVAGLLACKPAKKEAGSAKSKPDPSQQEISRRIEEFRQAGYPTTIEELGRWIPEVPESENAAIKIGAAVQAIKAAPDTLKKFPRRTERMPAASRNAVSQFLADNQVARQQLHAAARLSRARYPVEWKGWLMNIRFPQIEGLKNAAYVMQWEAIACLENGQTEKAAESIVVFIRLAQSLDEDPVIISQLVRNALAAIARRNIEWVLNHRACPSGSLTSMQTAMEELEKPEALTRGLAGELCGLIQFFQASFGEATNFLASASELLGEKMVAGEMEKMVNHLRRNKDADFLFTLETFDSLLKASRQKYPAQLADMEAIFAKVTDATTSEQHLVSRSLISPLAISPQKFAVNVALLRTTSAALAVERYRSANSGRLPGSLADLVPKQLSAIPEDPFTGEPLKYKKLAKGFVVYSVGGDRQDNGGAEKTPVAGDEAGKDITFTVKR